MHQGWRGMGKKMCGVVRGGVCGVVCKEDAAGRVRNGEEEGELEKVGSTESVAAPHTHHLGQNRLRPPFLQRV